MRLVAREYALGESGTDGLEQVLGVVSALKSVGARLNWEVELSRTRHCVLLTFPQP